MGRRREHSGFGGRLHGTDFGDGVPCRASEFQFAWGADSVWRQACGGEGDCVVDSDALLVAVGPAGGEAASRRSWRDEDLPVLDIGQERNRPDSARVVERRVVVGRRHEGFVVVAEVEVDALSELPHVGHAAGSDRRFFGAHEDGEEDRRQDCDDRYDDEQLDEGEASCRALHRNRYSVSVAHCFVLAVDGASGRLVLPFWQRHLVVTGLVSNLNLIWLSSPPSP